MQNTPVNTRELRDELVRALMPELRTLVEHLVSVATDRSVAPLLERQRELQGSLGRSGAPAAADIDAAIARSIAPLLERQRTLEATLAELQRSTPAPKASGRAPQHLAEAPLSPGVHAETQAWVASSVAGPPVEPAMARALPAPREAVAIGSDAFDTTPWADIPAELDGTRRKRIVLWLLVVGALALLGTAVGLSVMSNAAAQF